MVNVDYDSYEYHMRIAVQFMSIAAWEEAARALDEAKKRLGPTGGYWNPDEVEIERKYGEVERRKGNYALAAERLQRAIRLNNKMDFLKEAAIFGELGVVYLHQDEYVNARRAFDDQKFLARDADPEALPEDVLRAQAEICRAVGNIGFTKYLLATTRPSDDRQSLLQAAIQDLSERVSLAVKLQTAMRQHGDFDGLEGKARMWRSIGLDRLTLCHLALNQVQEAVKCGLESWSLTQAQADPTVRALSRFYYGNVLLAQGRELEAKAHWDHTADGSLCTSAMALCKEPSTENNRHLRKLLNANVRFDLYDEQEYSALDYAILAGNRTCAAIVEYGLRNEFSKKWPEQEGYVEEQIAMRRLEAKRRKEYRDIFQAHIRPLLSANLGRTAGELRIANLRQSYAQLLENDQSKREAFDKFKFIPFTDLRDKLQRLPNPDDRDGLNKLGKLMKKYDPTQYNNHPSRAPYVIFFSYEWLGKYEHLLGHPDNHGHTQYNRMLNAVECLLALPPEVTGARNLTEDRIHIWLVSISIIRKQRFN